MEARYLQVPILSDRFGFIGVVEGGENLPFAPKRFYFIGGVPEDASRGSHAHRELQQVILALSGSVVIELDNGDTVREFVLDGPHTALYVPPGYWRTLRSFAPNTVIGVLASKEYDEADYFRAYQDFLKWKRNG